MLTFADFSLIALTTAGITALVSLLAFGLLRLNKSGGLTSQFAVVVGAAIASVACSTWAVAREMYFSPHELGVLLWILGAAALMSLGAAWLTARSARGAIAALRESVRRVGRGDVVDATGGWKELAEVSAQLADTSERLAAARVELENLDATRREFFAWISHDLRTPLAGIAALAEALEMGVASDPEPYLRRMRAQVATMTRLVDDLFELSRLNSGAFRLNPEAVGLLEVVSDAVADVSELAAARGVRITHAGVDGQLIWADPHGLTRVVVNLLTNAIRHAPSGSEVSVRARRDDAGRLVLSVLDQGGGVAPADLGSMFDVGWRASASRTASSEDAAGAGLGLAIVRGIVEAHGGDVRAEHVDEGFQLQVRLPVAAVV